MTAAASTLFAGAPVWPDGVADWHAALARWGPTGAAAHAQGPFALADASTGVATVDRFAVQTLCWRHTPDGVRVALRADALGGSEIDPQALFDYLYFHVIPAPRTIFRGVQRLPAGHVLVDGEGGPQAQPYWRPRFEPRAKPDFAALAQRFRRLLSDAVRAELGQGTPACFLSGGTDSSTIAGMLRQVAGQAHTYSIGFDAEGYDEMEYARIAARHFGTVHHEYYVTPDDLVRHIPAVAAAYDQPFGNSSALPAYLCALKARGDGVTKLLAGDGGDELFGGNARYATQQIYGHYARVPQVLRRGLIEPLLAVPGAGAVNLLRRGRNYVRDANTPLPDRTQGFNLLRRLGMGQVLTPEFRAAVDEKSVLQQQRDVWALPEAGSELDRMLAFDWRYTLAEADLPKVRGTCALAGIDVGFPMLDGRLVDFSMQLPADYKLRGQQLRWFFKEALRGFLPDEIIAKTKKGFGLPFGVWALRHAPLMALASDSARGFAARGVVQPGFVEQLLRERLPEAPGYYGEMVWILMMAEQWLRHHAPDWRLRT
ncbi:MAG: asparagine synthetase B family protein [Betaproteobacteria bacterium]|jgi:asparagine synthase (glutamine-hydrolysing)|nr:asparagine synthase C-terminal domain-containing protein [Rubrivivax sp.]